MLKRCYMLCYLVSMLAVALPAASAENAPPLNESDTRLVINWIARQVADSRQDYCYRESYGRGVGAPVNACHENEDKNGALCYPKCREGFHGVGPVCWEECPAGYTDTGLTCTRPAATEHITRKLADCPKGFHNTGVSCYDPKKLATRPLSHSSCEPGLHRDGAYCFSDCPSGFTNMGVSCVRSPEMITKKSYGRGVGTPMYCKPGTDNDAALCYPYCREGFHGVGPVCWEKCPSGRTDCGAGCASSTKACLTDTAKMITAPVSLAMNLGEAALSMKSSGPLEVEAIKNALNEANAGYRIGQTVDLWVTDAIAHFETLTTPAVKKELEARFHGDALTWIERQYALNHLHLMLTKDLNETALNGLRAVAGFDPTGVTSVIAAFAKPICTSADPFPNVTVH